jgi:hypothetical protein
MSLKPVVVGATILVKVVGIEVDTVPRSCSAAYAPALAPARTATATACFNGNLVIFYLLIIVYLED